MVAGHMLNYQLILAMDTLQVVGGRRKGKPRYYLVHLPRHRPVGGGEWLQRKTVWCDVRMKAVPTTVIHIYPPLSILKLFYPTLCA